MTGEIDILDDADFSSQAPAGQPKAMQSLVVRWALDGARVAGTIAGMSGAAVILAVYDGESLLGRVRVAAQDGCPTPWQFFLPMPLIDGARHPIHLRLPDGRAVPGADGAEVSVFRQTLRSTIDTCADGLITGWVYDVAFPGRSVEIGLYDGDSLIATAEAAVARPDVNAHFGIPGDHGFAIVLPRRLFDGREHALRLRAGDTVLMSAGDAVLPTRLSPPRGGAAARSAPSFAGRIEKADCHGIRGWAADLGEPGRPVAIAIVIDGLAEMVVTADAYRPDLVVVTGSGFHGFAVALPARLMNGAMREVEVRCIADGTPLTLSDGAIVTIVDFPLVDLLGRAEPVRPAPYCPAIDHRTRIVPATPPWRKRRRPRVSMIVLNWNGAALLDRLLTSIVATGQGEGLEVIVVDHASDDGSQAVAARFTGALALTVIARDANYSFSASNNLAADWARGDFLFFVNNDITFLEPCVRRLAAWLEADSTVGAVGMRLWEQRPAGERWRQRVHHDGIQIEVVEVDGEGALYRPVEVSKEGEPSVGACGIPAVTAAAMMVRRSDFQAIGGFDESYVYGQEDVDLCLRLRGMLGGSVICDSGVAALHGRGATRGTPRRDAPEPMAAVLDRQAGNRNLLASRFAPRLRRMALDTLIGGGMPWRVAPLRVVFIVTEASETATAGDVFTAREFGAALRAQFGWEVLFAGYRTLDLARADIVVVMRHDVDLRGWRGANPGLIAVAWVRNRVDEWLASPSFAAYHVVLASSRKACAAIVAQTGRDVTLLPIAANAARFDPGREPLARRSDIVFTGNNWGAARTALDQIDLDRFGPSLAIFGHGWKGHPRWGAYWQGALAYDEVARAYAGARIVIDDGHPVARDWASLNSRVFDASAAGALVITNCVEGAAEMFDGLLPSFTTRRQLNDLLARYLGAENERRALVARLRGHVLRAHRYEHRAPVLRTALSAASRCYRVAIKIAVPDPARRDNWGDWHFATGLRKALERLGCQVRIDCLADWSSGVTAGDDVNLVLRGLSRYRPVPGTVNLMWLISHPDAVDDDEIAGFDHVFVASEPYADKLATRHGGRVSALLQCTDPEIFHPALAPVADLPEALFVGNSRGVERPMLRDALAAGIDCAVIGEGWDALLPAGRLLAPHIPNRELFRYYAAGSILLADHWPDMAREGFLANRLFDAAACGATIVSDAVAGLDRVFGEAIPVCTGPDDLAAVLATLRADPVARKARAAGLQEMVRDRHSFDRRALHILDVIRERLAPL
ncbi:glycosyltransferase family protein [Chelatococcus asaccharovorans]|uniref:GT2 family glycosyltransferase n=1 Tax=Chelatococcus asaccharovorans TaxID=28210 RepID=A0A2V3TUM3_9HYPH|nr:glycosyltransferase [Chelatococcus asaccharovorans]MBS7704240.1 glycosyltransferase [Chelatococcus asaccharovorans]PXW53132.1 GT2 family glycosyltransferase [Chelatococcus asaccharovorans]